MPSCPETYIERGLIQMSLICQNLDAYNASINGGDWGY